MGHAESPEEIETLVTHPIETSILGSNGVQAVRSQSSMGMTVIYVEFNWNTEIRAARQVVQERLATIARVDRRLNELKQKGGDDKQQAAQIADLEKRLARLRGEQAAAEKAAAAAQGPIALTAIAQPPISDQPAALVREAYLRTLSRPPTEAELARGVQHITESPGIVAGLRDVLWALLNTKEFIVNH